MSEAAAWSTRVHAGCVAIGGRGVLLFGPSGAGKSDLALRLIDEGARLVSDDYTDLTIARGALLARAPANIRGKMEVRGIGIVDIVAVDDAPVSLLVDLGAAPERLPEAATRTYLDAAVPLVTIDPHTASAAAKVRLSLDTFGLPAR